MSLIPLIRLVLPVFRCCSRSAARPISCWFTGVHSVLSHTQDTPENASALHVSSHLLMLCKLVIRVTHHDLEHLRTEIKALTSSSERNILHRNAFTRIHICILHTHPLFTDPWQFMQCDERRSTIDTSYC